MICVRKLVCFLKKLPDETRIVMAYIGIYWQPIAKVLHDAGFCLRGECTANLQIWKQLHPNG